MKNMKKTIYEKTFSILITISLIAFTGIMSGCSENENESNNEEKAESLWQAGSTRNKIVTISDLHIGIDDNYAETVKNREILIQFLKRLHSTKDVRELVIVGDFLDEWYLQVFYPNYTDEEKFYKGVISNNQELIDELKHVIKSGIKLVYVPGNHDLTLEQKTLQEAIPGIVQVSDAQGLGVYYTGDRKEIAIEHGHRYDVFSAPDRISNKELCGNDNTILPAGYFYARYAATWVIEGKPNLEKNYPTIDVVPASDNIDQLGAYKYYRLLETVSQRFTPNEELKAKIFKMHIAGFNDDYSYLDFYPQLQSDGTISGKLYKNIQRTWAERQKQNNVKVPNSFIEALNGAINWDYYVNQAKVQYIDNNNEKVDVVVFGHTHVPDCRQFAEGKYYINDGTWVDHNSDSKEGYTRTFAVITTGNKDSVELYMYEENGTLKDLKSLVMK